MDGITLLKQLAQDLNEAQTATFPDVRTSFDYIYQAACMTVDRTRLLTTTQSIATVATQRNYELNPNYMRMYMVDNQGEYFLKYNDGTSDYFIRPRSIDSITLANQTTSVSIPQAFAIRDATTIAQLTGITTATGALTQSYTMFGQTLGETTLTNSSGVFTNVKVGDMVHNITDGGHGLVIALPASPATTSLICALFYGTNNFFTSGDSYIINPQQRFELYFDPPPLTSAHTITFPYLYKPNPVYSAYRSYPLPMSDPKVLTHYACWLYKYRDREASFGDAFYKYWDHEVILLGKAINNAKTRKGFSVNLIRRADRSWTYR